ncbi:hypothetical protein [Streptomyces niveus]|uniref:hypothetical protein n=1 Tax=Streptomyces niveus TaxID=193462 RepID=UPI003445CD41
MQRSLPALFGAAILTVGAGVMPVAAAPSQAVAVSSPTSNASAQECVTSTTYSIRACLALVSSTFVGQATVHSIPSNCAGYRVSLYNYYDDTAVASTSLRPCSETLSKQVTADASRFINLTAYARFVMYDSAGKEILAGNTPQITYS